MGIKPDMGVNYRQWYPWGGIVENIISNHFCNVQSILKYERSRINAKIKKHQTIMEISLGLGYYKIMKTLVQLSDIERLVAPSKSWGYHSNWCKVQHLPQDNYPIGFNQEI